MLSYVYIVLEVIYTGRINFHQLLEIRLLVMTEISIYLH